jgi:hypothetical protein
MEKISNGPIREETQYEKLATELSHASGRTVTEQEARTEVKTLMDTILAIEPARRRAILGEVLRSLAKQLRESATAKKEV